jgi:hypothetical protein
MSTNLSLILLSCIVQLWNSLTVEGMQKYTSEYQIFYSFIEHFNDPNIRAPLPFDSGIISQAGLGCSTIFCFVCVYVCMGWVL